MSQENENTSIWQTLYELLWVFKEIDRNQEKESE